MNTAKLTVNIRVTVNGARVPGWRLRILGRVAKLLRIPLEVEAES